MQLYHDSQNPLYRSPLGTVPCNTQITLRLRAEGASEATLRYFDGSEHFLRMTQREGLFEVILNAPDTPMLCWYDFFAPGAQGTERYGCAADGLGGEGEQGSARAYQITVYDGAYKTPRFLREGVMYQIFPDRFFASKTPVSDRDEIYLHQNWSDLPILMPEGGDDNCARDFFGGDLKGIEQKLPYLAELGVTVIYLNPIFKARSNHRYDTGDYTQIDPMLGTNEDFASLCAAAKTMGIHILLDGVFSHTGEDSRYFNKFGRYPTVGAYQSTDSEYFPWYSFEHYPERYACWWGIHTLPAVNKDCESYRRFMLSENGVARAWLKNGAAGWRLDVADELPMRFIRDLRTAVQGEKDDAVLLGEVWEDASHKVAYGEMRCYCLGDTLDSVMNYPLREAAIDFFTGKTNAFALCRLIKSQQENYPAPFYYSVMNLPGSHDRARAINVLCGKSFDELPCKERAAAVLTRDEYALGRARYIAMLRLLCALPGIPCVYYGDEAGMTGAADPYCRGTFPWGKEDRALTEEVKSLLWQRRHSRALQTGALEIAVLDADTLRIRRVIDDHDIFGDPAPDEIVEIVITRT